MGNIEKKTSMENNEIPKGIDGKKVEKYLNKEDLSNVKKALKNVDSPKALKVVKKIDKKLKNVDGNNSKKLEDSLKKGKDYPDYINIYGVGKKVGGNTYDGVGIKLHNDNFEGKFEYGKNYNLASAIGKIDITDNTYSKIGASYLKYDNYKIGEYSIDPKQETGGIAFGGGNKKFNVEAGYIHSKLDGAAGANTDIDTFYVEGVDREKTSIGQFDLGGTAEYTKVYNEEHNEGNVDLSYYPTDYVKINTDYNTVAHDKNGYRVSGGIKYTFGGGKKGGWSPYMETSYNTGEHTKVGVSFEENIADRPVKWKDEFENQIGSNKIKAAKIAPDKFKEKVVYSKELEKLDNLLNEGNDKGKKNKDDLSELDNLLNEGNDKDKKKTNNFKDNKDDIGDTLDHILGDDNDNNNQKDKDNSKNNKDDIGDTLDHILGDDNDNNNQENKGNNNQENKDNSKKKGDDLSELDKLLKE